MYAKSTLLFALLTVSAKLATATAPPACLIAAVNEQPDPSNLKSCCGPKSNEIQSYLKKNCGDNLDAAMTAYKAVCKSAPSSVSSDSSSSTKSESGSGSASATGASRTGGASGSGSTIVATSTYYDTVCGCTKTAVLAGTSSGFSTASGGAIATPTASAGNGTAPSAPAAPGSPSGGAPSASGTGAASPASTTPPFTAGAARSMVGSLAAAAVVAAGFVIAL